MSATLSAAKRGPSSSPACACVRAFSEIRGAIARFVFSSLQGHRLPPRHTKYNCRRKDILALNSAFFFVGTRQGEVFGSCRNLLPRKNKALVELWKGNPEGRTVRSQPFDSSHGSFSIVAAVDIGVDVAAG